MIAIAKIGGHQELVTVGEKIEVDKLDAEVGASVEFEVLLTSDENGDDCKVGSPILEGVKVTAKVIEHGRGDKIRVFKMKPRKRYRRTKGHRQDYTAIEITAIGGAKKAPAKKTAVKEDKPAEKVEKKVAPAKKKAAPKKESSEK